MDAVHLVTQHCSVYFVEILATNISKHVKLTDSSENIHD